MTALRALAERASIEDSNSALESWGHSEDGAIIQRLLMERATLARALLRLLEAGDGMKKMLETSDYYNDVAIAAWDAAVRGEEGG